MMDTEWQVDGVAYLQNPDPIVEQSAMPNSLQLMELSWDRTAGYMRLVIGGQGKWYFNQVSGTAEILSADETTGRLSIWAIPSLNNGELVLTRDPAAPPHPMVPDGEIAEVLNPTLHRLCYRRQANEDGNMPEHLWQVWQESLFPHHHRFVSNYVGDLSISWPKEDEAPHIFHQGLVVIAANNTAHFYDLDLKDYL